jgi:hypothetical protein
MKTTLNEIQKHNPQKDLWETLLRHLNKTKPDDEPLSLSTVLESNGLDHALWCFRAVKGFVREKFLLAVAFARGVEHLMPDVCKTALDVAERYANGLATEEELARARADAYAVAGYEGYSDYGDAARAIYAAAYAAACAASHAVTYSARSAAAWAAYTNYAAYDSDDGADADYDAANAAYDAAHSEILKKQTEILKQFLKDNP